MADGTENGAIEAAIRTFPYAGTQVRLRRVRRRENARPYRGSFHSSELAHSRGSVWATNVYAINRSWRIDRPRFDAPGVWIFRRAEASAAAAGNASAAAAGNASAAAAGNASATDRDEFAYCVLEPSRAIDGQSYRDVGKFLLPEPHYRLYVSGRAAGVVDDDKLRDEEAFLRRARRMLGSRIDVAIAADSLAYPSRQLRLPPASVYARVYYILAFDGDDECETLTRGLVLISGSTTPRGSDDATDAEKLATRRPWVCVSVRRDFPHDAYVPHSVRTYEDEASATVFCVSTTAYVLRARAMCRRAGAAMRCGSGCGDSTVPRVPPVRALDHTEFHRYESRRKGPVLTVECTHDYAKTEIVPRASVALTDLAEHRLRRNEPPQLRLVHDSLVRVRVGETEHAAFVARFRCCRRCDAFASTAASSAAAAARCERCDATDVRVVRTFSPSSNLQHGFRIFPPPRDDWTKLPLPPDCCVPTTLCARHRVNDNGAASAMDFAQLVLSEIPSARWNRSCAVVHAIPRTDHVADATHRAVMRDAGRVTLSFERSATLYYARKRKEEDQ